MSNTAIPTRPPSNSDTLLREKFDESIAAQSEQMDKLGQQLITLELAIPGLYATVLKLISGEGTTLNDISQIYDARGDYDTALSYLQQSLAIRQEIGDVAGLCATLFNMGHIHLQNDEQQQAMQAWVTVYRLASQMNLAQVLNALENLAPQLGLQNGLAGWEQLAQQMEEQ